jgi:DNA replication protein DnaC
MLDCDFLTSDDIRTPQVKFNVDEYKTKGETNTKKPTTERIRKKKDTLASNIAKSNIKRAIVKSITNDQTDEYVEEDQNELSAEQKQILEQALRGNSLLISGGAGSGKSLLLRKSVFVSII